LSSPAPQSLADRLQAARQRHFIGRQTELDLFQNALTAETLPFAVLYVHGPGGVGKTSLMRQYSRLAGASAMPVYYLDGENFEPAPRAFLAALAAEMGLVETADPRPNLTAEEQRQVLIIDRYEAIASLDRWLRQTFLPQLPATTLVVLAGREGPPAPWRSDPGWRALFRAVSLRNFNPAETITYLTQASVPPDQHEHILAFTHGYPLALSLIADLYEQQPDFHFQPAQATDLIRHLVARFMENVPSPVHRAALEAAALVRLTTEQLLADMLDLDDAHELFTWLSRLSIMEAGARGLAPHSLARETLVADLRWRNPDRYADLHQRARSYYKARVQQSQGLVQQEMLIDYIFLHRDNAVVRPFYEQLQNQRHDTGAVFSDQPQAGDWPHLRALVARHEGEASAQLAQFWFERQPEGVLLYRDQHGQPVGFLAMVALEQATAEERAHDPATAAAWQFLQVQTPLRTGERATYFRFWLVADTYQAVSPVQSLIFVQMVRHYLTTPGLAFTFLACAQPNFWSPIFLYADLMPIPAADFTVGGHTYGVFGHDWRAVPPLAWLDLLAQRETAVDPHNVPRPQQAEPVLVLSRETFAEAVRHALRHFTRPDQLSDNPLLHSRLVLGESGQDTGRAARLERLQTSIRETADSLRADPRRRKYYKALYHAYIQPAPTHEQAAEVINVPYGTFRRHLKRGLENLVELLWQREIGHIRET
jgi:hypothetical protein